MSEPDELYTLRNLFWLGNFQQAINEATGLHRLPASMAVEKEEFVYRSYLALGQYNIILTEIKDNASTAVGLRAIKLLATYLSEPTAREVAKLQLEEWLKDPAASTNATVRLIAAILNMHDDNCKEAIKHVRFERSLEQSALLIQLYLRLERADLARNVLKAMKIADEDSVLVALGNAWINLSPGANKAVEAAYAFEELIDKYGSSAMLQNSLAVAKMQQGLFEEAETNLNEALKHAPMDPDALANLICVAQHLGRPIEVVNRYISQLQAKAPGHALIQSLKLFNSAFDRVSATLA